MKVGLLIFLLAELAMVEIAVTDSGGRPINPLKILRGSTFFVIFSSAHRICKLG